MYKKVRFNVMLTEEWDLNMIKTVLTDGFALHGIVESNSHDDHWSFQFIVNRYDLRDLRTVVETLVKAGYNVKETEAT